MRTTNSTEFIGELSFNKKHNRLPFNLSETCSIAYINFKILIHVRTNIILIRVRLNQTQLNCEH